MRAACVIALLGCAASLAVAAEQEFPYTAYIAPRAAAIRSGPGRSFYASQKLRQGDEVEVYHHEDDWCAIRPPQDSFSWVQADDVRIDRDGIGLVLTEGAPSRVGSRISDHRDVIQVRLERGEQVDVLDAVQVSNDNGVIFYCKIAPPSGEFRWVHKDDISREPPELEADEHGESRTNLDSTRRTNADERPANHAERWGSWVRSRRADGGDGRFRDPTRASRAENSGQSIALASADDDRNAGNNSKQDATSANSHDDAWLAAELDAIDRELSRIVVEEPARWNLEALRQRTKAAVNNAKTALARGRARELESKIAKLADIHERSLVLIAPHSDAGIGMTPSSSAEQRTLSSSGATITIPSTSSPPRDSSTTAVAGDTGARYDGLGKLTRVVSQRPNAPRYALVNNANEVVSFVSPAPGVNLQVYEGQYVGISGQRGYMPELKKPHVTALRVTPIQAGQTSVARRR